MESKSNEILERLSNNYNENDRSLYNIFIERTKAFKEELNQRLGVLQAEG